MTQADIKRRQAEEAREAALPGKLTALRGRVGEVVRRWIASAIVVSTGLHRSPDPEQQAERFPAFPKGTPKWAEGHVRKARAVAEQAAQVVWPAFDDPRPLPPVTEGRRNAWSFYLGDRPRVFPTSAGSVSWSELVEVERERDGRTVRVWVRDHDRSGTVAQYATRLDALRAAHYALCRHKSAILYQSLLRCEETARGPKS